MTVVNAVELLSPLSWLAMNWLNVFRSNAIGRARFLPSHCGSAGASPSRLDLVFVFHGKKPNR